LSLCLAMSIVLSLLFSYVNLVLIVGLILMANCLLNACGLRPACYVYSIINTYRIKLNPYLKYARLTDYV
ncbi:MAG: hypothetical protein ABI761_16240, partial [Saprospiraceae bacterium]